jgi:hypothetical protein
MVPAVLGHAFHQDKIAKTFSLVEGSTAASPRDTS